jgi:hypothetical protein
MTSCIDCGRQLPTEDLVSTSRGLMCAPCHRERAAAEERRDSIDAAWAAVEAALPLGWAVEGLVQYPIGTWEATAEPTSDGQWAPTEGPMAMAVGSTPAGALRALANKLSEET